MKLLLRALLLGLICGLPLRADSATPVMAGPEGQRAFTALPTLYTSDRSVPFQPPPELNELNSADGAKSKQAGDYILALFEQSSADETNGRTEWKSLPFWGGGSENPARIFRGNLADAFGKSASSPAALSAALWLINSDLVEDDIANGAQVLAQIHGSAADAAILDILQKQHPSQKVLVMALQEAAARHLLQGKASVIALEQSYRSAVRKAAQDAALKLGEPHVREYDRSAPLSPRIVEFLKKTSERMMTQIPEQATWEKTASSPYSGQGWLTQETYFQWSLLTYFAEQNWVNKYKKQLEPGMLSDVAEDIITRRAKITTLQNSNSGDIHEMNEALGSLSHNGMLSGQFEPRFISLPEITVATWCWQRGDIDHCRRLLDPCYDASDDDRWIDWAGRDYLGNVYHRQMIRTFCNDQDFPQTLAIAEHLSKPVFDGYNYQDRAKELAAQLTRKDADSDVSLPSVPVWSILQLCLSRQSQIVYLGHRLKLLHVEQTMQPGDVYYDDRMPYSLTGIYCINPYLELQRMNLSGRDFEALAPFAADRDFTLTYSYFRGFHPSRNLHRVDWVVQKLVNNIAGEPAERVGTIQEMLNGTAPKPKEILSRDSEGGLYFTANPSGDVMQEFKAWAHAQPSRGFWATWWQTPTALLICFLITRRYLKRAGLNKMPLKSLIFIFFLISAMAPVFVPYHENFKFLSEVSNLTNEIAKIFCWLLVVRIALWIFRGRTAPSRGPATAT